MESARESRRRRILERGSDRLAFISGQARAFPDSSSDSRDPHTSGMLPDSPATLLFRSLFVLFRSISCLINAGNNVFFFLHEIPTCFATDLAYFIVFMWMVLRVRSIGFMRFIELQF